MPSSFARHGYDPSRAWRRSACTWPTRCCPLWGAVQLETGDADAPLPYWAFAWGGGLAIAHYLRDHPEAVAGRRVFDLASGSGLVAIAAMNAGASAVTASDIDPFAVVAIGLNARANHHRITVLPRDVLDEPPPDVDVVLAGDCWYEAGLAERVLPWLQGVRAAGIEILVGDPGRRYLPAAALEEDRHLRGPDHDRARGSRAQDRPRLHGPGPVTRN